MAREIRFPSLVSGVVLLTLAATLAMAPALKAAPVTLDLWNDKPTWTNWFNEMSKLSATRIGVGIKPVGYADTSSFQSAVRAALSSATPPDLFTWWSENWMSDLVAAGLVQDITPIWKKYIDAGEINPDMAKPYTFNGKIYGVPTANDYYFVFYNVSVFEQLGIAIPKTWEEFLNVAETLKRNDVTPIGVTIQDRWPSFIWFQQLIVGTDPDLYADLMTGKVRYTDPRIVKVMETWKSMIDKGYFSNPTIPGVGTTGQSLLAALFRQGKIGMILWGDWYNAFLSAPEFRPGIEYKAFLMPKLNPSAPNAIIFESGPIAVAARARNKEAALKFVDWWLSVEAQTKWNGFYPTIPTNKKVTPGNPILAQAAEEVAKGNYRLLTRFWEATPTPIVEQAVDQLDRFMLDPSTLHEVLEATQKTADQYWSTHK